MDRTSEWGNPYRIKPDDQPGTWRVIGPGRGGPHTGFAVPAAAAEYELELRAERQAEGIAAAKRREATGAMLPGKKKTGRPRVIGPAELATLRRLVDEGVSITEAARTLKIGRSTAYAALAGR
ncbi:helix-turn-helix domain-containing protein [Sphaerisporangium perillae]|uniref:helix-turn-helix domain-containing protein n=1 Tax=Sphaerisporangium perillae TaxID=2935860 RepID=UPI00200E3C65|nr:recombinase family protein [Sphaerisporangium perillae]